MADNIFAFLKTYLGNVGIFGIILIILEKIMEDDFVCPCEEIYNISICGFYAVIPAFCCFAYTLCFMDLSQNTRDGGTQDNSMRNNTNDSTPPSPQTDGGTQDNSTDKKVKYSLLTALFWICIFFLDGRYVACAFSEWKGVYTKNESFGILKWCKPTGNEPSVLESQQKTLKWMCRSQIVGFFLMLIIACLLPSKSSRKCVRECCCCSQNSDTQEQGRQNQEPLQQQNQEQEQQADTSV